MSEEKLTPPPADEDREAAVRSARVRAAAVLIGTVALGMALYFAFAPDTELAGACVSNADCPGAMGVECLHAPTGAYCTHSCTSDTQCGPHTHCGPPPWEEPGGRAVCLRDTKPSGK